MASRGYQSGKCSQRRQSKLLNSFNFYGLFSDPDSGNAWNRFLCFAGQALKPKPAVK